MASFIWIAEIRTPGRPAHRVGNVYKSPSGAKKELQLYSATKLSWRQESDRWIAESEGDMYVAKKEPVLK